MLGLSGLKLERPFNITTLKQIANKAKRKKWDLVQENLRSVNWDLPLGCSIVSLLLRIRKFASHARRIEGVPAAYRYA